MRLKDQIKIAVLQGAALAVACGGGRKEVEPEPCPMCADALLGESAGGPAQSVNGPCTAALQRPGSWTHCTVVGEGGSCSVGRFRQPETDLLCGPYQNSSGQCCAVLMSKPETRSREQPECGPIPTASGESASDCEEEENYNRGRPFVVAGETRRGEVQSSGPTMVSASLSDASPAERATLAVAWARAGAEEHASIASFSRFLLDLMSLGAPSELIIETTRAIEDEVRHAEQCFRIASRFADETLGPGPIDVGGAITAERTDEMILREAIAEGCIGETIAAAAAGWLAPHAADDDIAEVLKRICEDEGRHAALAWKFVAWMLAERPYLRAVAQEAFALDRRPDDVEFDLDAADVRVRYGILPSSAERGVASRAMEEVVRPCAEEFLRAS